MESCSGVILPPRPIRITFPPHNLANARTALTTFVLGCASQRTERPSQRQRFATPPTEASRLRVGHRLAQETNLLRSFISQIVATHGYDQSCHPLLPEGGGNCGQAMLNFSKCLRPNACLNNLGTSFPLILSPSFIRTNRAETSGKSMFTSNKSNHQEARRMATAMRCNTQWFLCSSLGS